MNCKRMLSILIALLALSLLLCGCRGSDPGGLNGASEAPSSIGTTEALPSPETTEGDTWENLHYDPVTEPTEPEDPYPPEAYEYSLGTLVDVDFSDKEWMEKLSADGEVYQMTKFFDWNQRRTIPLRVRLYETFPVITGTPGLREAVPRFRGRYDLMWNNGNRAASEFSNYVYIHDPAVFAAVEDLVMSLEYAPTEDQLSTPTDWVVDFCVMDRLIRNGGYFTIMRDGTVYRYGNGDGIVYAAVTPLSEEATDYFYAISVAQQYTAGSVFNFFSGMQIEKYKALWVQSEGTDLYLKGEDAEALAKLLSDEEFYYVRATPRFNCDPVENGTVLYEITLGNIDSEDKITHADCVFTLWSDGHLSIRWDKRLCAGEWDHDQIMDGLIAPSWYVSETAFEIAAVEAFLAEHSG